MAEWVEIAKVADCPPGTALEVVAGDRIVAVFNVDGTFSALDGVCPHQGGPLGQGLLNGCIVTCPWHGWQFDVRSGQSQLSASIAQTRIDVRVDGGAIFAHLESEQ
jgi:nitrite reductase/ring-hydroxylating ferredoxin subunit